MQDNSHVDEVVLWAPENFSMVENGIYRSGFPRTKNCAFLRNLGLKSVISLVPEDYPEALLEYYSQVGIKLISLGLEGNKYPFKSIDVTNFKNVLRAIIDPNNQPCLIHCNKGKHRTGCVVACLRSLRGWAFSSVSAEYLLFSGSRSRLEDQIFIEELDLNDFKDFIHTSSNNSSSNGISNSHVNETIEATTANTTTTAHD